MKNSMKKRRDLRLRKWCVKHAKGYGSGMGAYAATPVTTVSVAKELYEWITSI